MIKKYPGKGDKTKFLEKLKNIALVVIFFIHLNISNLKKI